MINLLVRKKGLTEAGQKYKARVLAVTAVVLVVYLLAVATSAGWWIWVTARNATAIKEKDSLVQQLGQQATTEAAMRQVAARAEIVETALANPKLGPILTSAQTEAQSKGLEIVGWKDGIVTVGGTSLMALEDFAQNREVKSVKKISEGIWEQEVVWK